MKKGRIAGWKIDRVANGLTSGIEDKRQALYDKMEKQLADYFLGFIPKEVVDFWQKYPERVVTMDSYWLKAGNNNTGLSLYCDIPDLPKGMKREEVLNKNPQLKAELITLALKRKELEKERRVLINKIKCTISSLGTYKQLENEFPEAFKYLVKEVDKEEIVEARPENRCDSVEELRAELSKKA